MAALEREREGERARRSLGKFDSSSPKYIESCSISVDIGSV